MQWEEMNMASLAGIDAKRVKYVIYSLSGLFAAVGGILMTLVWG